MPEGATTGIDRRTYSSQIYHLLEAKVLSGALAPGSKLSEESLAEMFGVSRSPAREALAELERVGLAVRSGPRDRMVAVPTAELIAQKYDVWWIVDSGRTYLASLDATAADHAAMRGHLDDMAKAVKTRNREQYFDGSNKFHEKIRGGCRNANLNELGAACDLYLKWFETLYDRAPEMSQAVVDEHFLILAAFEKKDLPMLYDTIRVHLYRQRERILGYFQDVKAGPAAKTAQRQPRPN